MLWQGNDLRGRFDDADTAKAKHADELGLK
jgi:hypothetical protein